MPRVDLLGGILKNVRAIIWRNEGDRKLFLITQELSGNFTVPGGCKDLEDRDLECALHRELHEELGLEPKDYRVSRIAWEKEYEDLYRGLNSERAGKKTIIYPFLVYMKEEVPFTVQAGEIKDAAWLDEGDARRALDYSPHMKEVFEVGLKSIEA
ncbi:MAG: NUDIX domain-containing protein [Minisyncoccia bacterium]